MREFKIVCYEENFTNDLNETVRSFYPYANTSEEGEIIELKQSLNGDNLTSILILNANVYTREDKISSESPLLIKRYKKRFLKLLLYKTLSNLFSVNLPWGSLTGIRPTKLGYELMGENGGNISQKMIEQFYLSPEKSNLIEDIIFEQKNIYDRDNDSVDLYVNIPFCVSRCTYCSFVSAIIDQKKKLIQPYVEALSKELVEAQKIITENGYKLRSIYCGGGTPTSFSAENLFEIFKNLTLRGREFTIESGRPDSVNEDKFKAFFDLGVDRISINPQTFNPDVLERIGRKHSVEDIYTAFALARKFPFNINMDLIADLPGDTLESFLSSVDRSIELSPENITVHTLSIKHSSSMQSENYDNRINTDNLPSQMVSGARERLKNNDYFPYYLYRQKYTSGNLENTGYAKKGKACIYNVDVMEETTSTISCGAGGISKKVDKFTGRIERQGIVKNIEQYIREIDEIIDKKRKFFTKNVLL